MKKNTLSIIVTLLLFPGFRLFAQQEAGSPKLKDVQPASIWVPSPVKVDGKLSEWNNSFQAYNKATKLYYTLANDDKNIYLAIKSTDVQNNAKIIAGGITFTLNTDDKKKEKDAFSLTYPVRPARGPGGPGGPNAAGVTRVVVGGGGGDNVRIDVRGFGGPGNTFTVDSAMIKAAHERTIAAAKEIKVFGFKDIADSLISIYNEYGIKAAIGYDDKGNFTYELAIPLNALSLSVDNAKEFAYNVKVNGLQLMMRMNMDGGGPGGGGRDGGGGGGGFGGGGGGGGGFPGGGNVSFGGPGGGNNSFQDMISPSDFWEEYTLSKKQ